MESWWLMFISSLADGIWGLKSSDSKIWGRTIHATPNSEWWWLMMVDVHSFSQLNFPFWKLFFSEPNLGDSKMAIFINKHRWCDFAGSSFWDETHVASRAWASRAFGVPRSRHVFLLEVSFCWWCLVGLV